MSTDLTVQQEPYELTVSARRFEVMSQTRNTIVAFIENQLQPGHDYGTIPGCGDKPTLFQPGAQKIMALMRVYADNETTITELGGDHREYTVKTRLKHVAPGGIEITVNTGTGSCSTRESKYAYRSSGGEDTGKAAPQAYWNAKKAKDMAKAQEAIGGKGFSVRKNEHGKYTIHKASSDKVANPDIADVYNTVLKMAIKRANMAAVINMIGGWSDRFAHVDADPELEPQPAQNHRPEQPRITKEDIRKEYSTWSVDDKARFDVYMNDCKVEGLTDDDAIFQAYNRIMNT